MNVTKAIIFIILLQKAKQLLFVFPGFHIFEKSLRMCSLHVEQILGLNLRYLFCLFRIR